MGALNVPKNKIEVPDQAKGNPVYEQTSQDMPLWCCGRNCGRNSRITVFIFGVIGIICSTCVCLSPNYFSFVSLRNDTFYDLEKSQPKPFEYATEANVGLFRYQINEVFEYPWPPTDQRELFDAMHDRELERLAASDEISDSKDEQQGSSSSASSILKQLRRLQNKFPDKFYDDEFTSTAEDDDDGVSQNATVHQTDTTGIILTRAPTETPPGTGNLAPDQIPEVLPGSNAISRLPTSTPTSAPTGGNPNDLVDVEIGVVKPYPPGVEFDSLVTNGQTGALWAPILATLGLAFGMMEFCCCLFKCSWLPAAMCLYGAFMMQMMTLFLFMSEDFCKYSQDCALGFSGVLSVVAVMAYFICQTLICMTPRPPPLFNLCNKTKTRTKKKKKSHNEWDETQGPTEDDDGFADEPDRPASFIGSYDGDPVDMYDDDNGYSGDYDYGYDDGYADDDGYNDGYEDGDQGSYLDGDDDGDEQQDSKRTTGTRKKRK